MTGNGALAYLDECDGNDRARLAQLAKRILAESREAPQAIVRQCVDPGVAGFSQAAFVAPDLRELAWSGVEAHWLSAAPAVRKELASLMVDALVALRRDLARKLDQMIELEEGPTGELPAVGQAEGESPRRRCDVAFGLLCRLLDRPLAGALAKPPDMEAFFKLPRPQRNEILAEWKRSKTRQTILVK